MCETKQEYACYCDVGYDSYPADDCVIDSGDIDDCIYAKRGMRKDQCEFWKPVYRPITYQPETPWNVEGNLVYNLRQDGWCKGKPRMANDVCVSIECRHLPVEIQEDIANTIFVALNRKYWNK